MTKLLVKNAKIAKSSNDTTTIYNFGIPAFKAADGLSTCPLAGQCAKGCYAQAGAYAWGNVKQAYEFRLKASQQANFPALVQLELNPKIKTAVRQDKQLTIRIHDSGDFYNLTYTKKWLKVMRNNPTVKFYAYTKMIPMFKALQKSCQIPENFTIIFSEGGVMDGMILAGDRHSRVFPDESSLISAGYDNASKNDLVAIEAASGKIGLIYHGVKSRAWATD